jgi:hypothetical protein
MTSLYKVVGLELTEENASIAVIASEQGFPQKVVGPKVYQREGTLGIKIGEELYPFQTETTEDGEVKLTLNGKATTLIPEGKNPVLKIAVGSGNFVKLPIYMNFSEESQTYYEFSDLESALGSPEAIAIIVGTPREKGSGVGRAFSDLKLLPIGTYRVIYAKNVQAKYGPSLDMLVSYESDLEIEVYNKNPETEKWELGLGTVAAGTPIKISGNTALRASLMGTELLESNNVLLEIVGHRTNKEGKIIVDASFDYSVSNLKFDF